MQRGAQQGPPEGVSNNECPNLESPKSVSSLGYRGLEWRRCLILLRSSSEALSYLSYLCEALNLKRKEAGDTYPPGPTGPKNLSCFRETRGAPLFLLSNMNFEALSTVALRPYQV